MRLTAGSGFVKLFKCQEKFLSVFLPIGGWSRSLPVVEEEKRRQFRELPSVPQDRDSAYTLFFFMKGAYLYGEHKTRSYVPDIMFERYGLTAFTGPDSIKPQEREEALKSLKTASRVL